MAKQLPLKEQLAAANAELAQMKAKYEPANGSKTFISPMAYWADFRNRIDVHSYEVGLLVKQTRNLGITIREMAEPYIEDARKITAVLRTAAN